MHSNLFMYLTAMSAVSIHNLANNIREATSSFESIDLQTAPQTNWSFIDEPTNSNNNNNSSSNGNLFYSDYPLCNGSSQSPIKVQTAATKENLNLRLGLTAFDKPMFGFLVNQFPTFRLVPFSFEWPRPSVLISNSLARSFNPYADSHFVLNYIQFHWTPWANNDNMPPLHQVNDNDTTTTNPLEIHFVHTNTAYENLEEALIRPDGLLILAVMAMPSTHESYVFDQILDKLTNITTHGKQVNFNEDSTWRSLLPTDTSRFYRYHGSLITPPCHQSVQWIIFESKLKLGVKQLKRLRKHRFLARDSSLNNKHNSATIDWSARHRSIRPLNGRIVERSFSLRPIMGRARNK